MPGLEIIQQLWGHCAWADAALFDALRSRGETTHAWREYAHVLGAEAVWLARLEQRASPVAVWPTLSVEEAELLRAQLMAGYNGYIGALQEDFLARRVDYRNSAGQEFSTPIGDILLHVALHGQYHRGKINLLLRQDGKPPAPVDYIGYVRGVPAAVTIIPERDVNEYRPS